VTEALMSASAEHRGAPSRGLIVNADDFGQSPAINRGVVEAHERGIVTSASLMVRWPAAEAAAAYARRRQNFSLGLHVDLGEWAHRRHWVPVYEVVSTDDPLAVLAEVERQVIRFRDLVGRAPTHVDSHQHIHRAEPVRSILDEVTRKLGVPLRQHSSLVRYAGDFYGQTARGEPNPSAIGITSLVSIIEQLPPGITELGCHPGQGDDLSALDTMYRMERERELATLCDPRVRAAVTAAGVRLCTFHDLVNGDAQELAR
jgi:predicted glycoside hydrolase/deacetylase ChbG (UPF0249 family)